jgi:hypothetical protein
MSKVYGSIRKNDKKANERQPDLRGSVRIGGFTGQRAEEKNREAASWLRNVAKEFSEKKETFLSVAVWKKVDNETDEPYLSICLEDNTWASKGGGQGGGQSSRPSVQNSEAPKTKAASSEGIDDIDF